MGRVHDRNAKIELALRRDGSNPPFGTDEQRSDQTGLCRLERARSELSSQGWATAHGTGSRDLQREIRRWYFSCVGFIGSSRGPGMIRHLAPLRLERTAGYQMPVPGADREAGRRLPIGLESIG